MCRAVSSAVVRRRRKFGAGQVSCTQCTGQGMTELIQTVKIETRLPIEGSFGKDHLEINFRRPIVIAELWRPEAATRKTLKKIQMFEVLSKNDPL